MDCLQLLMDQHKEAKQLFKELEKAEGAKAQQLFDELKMKLTMHEELEETHFYPELKKEKTTEELTLESYQEHHVMDVLIEEISALRPTDEAFKPKCTCSRRTRSTTSKRKRASSSPRCARSGIWTSARKSSARW